SVTGAAGNWSGLVGCTFWCAAGCAPSQYLLVHARMVTKCVAASDHPSSIETCTTSAASPQIGHHAAQSLVRVMAKDCPNRTVVMPDLRSCSMQMYVIRFLTIGLISMQVIHLPSVVCTNAPSTTTSLKLRPTVSGATLAS